MAAHLFRRANAIGSATTPETSDLRLTGVVNPFDFFAATRMVGMFRFAPAPPPPRHLLLPVPSSLRPGKKLDLLLNTAGNLPMSRSIAFAGIFHVDLLCDLLNDRRLPPLTQ